MIKHLVISGGMNTGMVFVGILKHLLQQSFFSMDDIETIYATSVGTLTAVYFSLGYPIDDIETFIIDRPWHHVFQLNFNTIVRAVQEGGLFTKAQFSQFLNPMLLGKDLETEITLLEFYEVTKKEIHFYTTSYDTFELVDISYKTHPHWKLIDAVYSSSNVPIIFDRFGLNDHFFLDGGLIKNYPLTQCLEDGHEPEHILGLYLRAENSSTLTNSNYKLFDYILSFLWKLRSFVKKTHHPNESLVLNQIPVRCENDPWKMIEALESKEERTRLISSGVEYAKVFLANLLSEEETHNIFSTNFSSE